MSYAEPGFFDDKGTDRAQGLQVGDRDRGPERVQEERQGRVLEGRQPPHAPRQVRCDEVDVALVADAPEVLQELFDGVRLQQVLGRVDVGLALHAM